MNFLMCIDEGVSFLVKGVINSIRKNNNVKINVYIFYDDLFQKTIKDIKSFFSAYNDINIFFIKVDGEIFDDFAINNNITKATYFRFLLGEYLPNEIDRILYIDTDIIVCSNLTKLYSVEFSKNQIFYAAPNYDLMTSRNHFNRLRLDIDQHYYVNAGVLLINVKEFKRKVSIDEVIKFEKHNKDVLIYEDQDIINSLFYKNIAYFDARKFNFIPALNESKDDFDKLISNASIIHFAGRPFYKPWRKEYGSSIKAKKIFLRYSLIDLKYVNRDIRLNYLFYYFNKIFNELCILRRKIFSRIRAKM